MRITGIVCVLIFIASNGWVASQSPAASQLPALVQLPAATTYYVSSSTGDDGNNGLSSGAPFRDHRQSECAELAARRPGAVQMRRHLARRAVGAEQVRDGGRPIEFSSYPAGCANKPVLSGSRPIGGWVVSDLRATSTGPTCRPAIFRWGSTSSFATASA